MAAVWGIFFAKVDLGSKNVARTIGFSNISKNVAKTIGSGHFLGGGGPHTTTTNTAATAPKKLPEPTVLELFHKKSCQNHWPQQLLLPGMDLGSKNVAKTIG